MPDNEFDEFERAVLAGAAPNRLIPNPRLIRTLVPPDTVQRGNNPAVTPTDVIGEMIGKRKNRLLNRPSQELLLPDTNIGFEIEIEGVDIRSLERTLPREIQQYFEWHQDNSLHDAGCEFTFRGPMYGEDVITALKAFFAYASTTQWTISSRCGIHIHVDARDLTRHNLLGMVAYYIIFEPALYAWVGNSRHANNFCVPWFKAEGSLQHAIRILHYMRLMSQGEASGRDVVAVCDHFHKYPGLNMKALHAYGSLEFRHLQTKLDYQHCLDWINIILSLKRAANDAPDSTMTIINQIGRYGVDYTGNAIFGAKIWKEMCQNAPLLIEEINEYGLPSAIEFIQGVLVAGDLKKPKSSTYDWPADTYTKTGEKEHKGLAVWRKNNFPKEPKENPEDQQRKELLSLLFASDIDLNLPRPRRITHGTDLPTMSRRGYVLDVATGTWLYAARDQVRRDLQQEPMGFDPVEEELE